MSHQFLQQKSFIEFGKRGLCLQWASQNNCLSRKDKKNSCSCLFHDPVCVDYQCFLFRLFTRETMLSNHVRILLNFFVFLQCMFYTNFSISHNCWWIICCNMVITVRIRFYHGRGIENKTTKLTFDIELPQDYQCVKHSICFSINWFMKNCNQ